MSRLIKFVLLQITLCITLYLVLFAKNKFEFSNAAREEVTITILSGDTATGELNLDRGDPVGVKNGDIVRWVIEERSNVKSFFITQKGTSEQIFKLTDRPPWPFYVESGKATVKDDAQLGEEYNYAIHWKAKGGKKKTFDPKIAVMSFRKIFDYFEMIIYIVFALVAIMLTFTTFRKKAGTS